MSSYTPRGQSSATSEFVMRSPASAAFEHDSSIFAQQVPNILHVRCSFNNTVVSLTTPQGDCIAWASGGTVGFKKANRAGYEPAFQATRKVLDKVEAKLGPDVKRTGVHVKFKGFGPGKDAVWKGVRALGWMVKMVEDATPVAHAGCRPRKARRL
ncbi:28S ribosomal protein S11, mitochondrial [Sorochytrium milnesiophthora]